MNHFNFTSPKSADLLSSSQADEEAYVELYEDPWDTYNRRERLDLRADCLAGVPDSDVPDERARSTRHGSRGGRSMVFFIAGTAGIYYVIDFIEDSRRKKNYESFYFD